MEQNATPPGRRNPTPRLLAFAAVGFVIVAVVALIGFRNTIARTVLRSVGQGLGYEISAGALDVNLAEANAAHVQISNLKGEPVLDAQRIEIVYSLRDLLPGGKRLFGLRSVVVDAPHVTVIHHADGGYNLTLPSTSPARSSAAAAPLDVQVRVSGGSVDVIDRFIAAPRERRERIVDIQAQGAISPSTQSTYRAGAVLIDAGKRYPIAGNARFFGARDFGLQHFTAARIPIATLANFALNSHAIVVQAGELRNVDVKLGALPNAAGAMQSHLGIRADLAGGRIASSALTKPVRDARAHFVIDDDSLTVRSLDAAINGLPLHVRGALYNFAAPQVKFALTVRGDLKRVGELSKDIAKLPLGGAIAVEALAEGPASNPLIFARFKSAALNYAAYKLDATRGFVAVSGQELDVLSAAARYGSLQLAGRGAVQLLRGTPTTAYGRVDVPANGLPYVDSIVPGMPLDGIAVVHGRDAKLAARGYLRGRNGPDTLDVPFAIANSGDSSVGPIVLQRHDGASLYARAIRNQAGQLAAVVDAHALSLLAAPAVTLPGLRLPPVPSAPAGVLDASLAGVADGTQLTSAGGSLHAYGPWGDLRADAAGSAAQVAARGRLTSSFERLAPFSGLGASGGIDVPFAVAGAGRTTIVQVQNARFPQARIRGIPLEGLNATLGIGPRSIDVYAATLRVAGRDVSAAGSFGNGGHVHLTAGDLDLATVRTAGGPPVSGRATVIADVGGTVTKPVATVLAALAGARYAATAIGGDVGLAYDGTVVHVDRATLSYAGAFADATGTVSGLALGRIAPRYDVRAQVADADIGALARTVKNPLRYPEGTLDADIRLAGAGASPSIAGSVRVPEGSLNGLFFRDARIDVRASASAAAANGGRVTVGGTRLNFSGSASRTQQSVRLSSPRVDLADFDDYFDEAEVLAGTGRVALALDAAPQRLTTSADLALTGARYRRFDLGTARATVRTAGTAVSVNAMLAGANGTARADGSIMVPGTDPLRDIARRSYVNVRGQISGVNLGNILPAAGVNVPLLGIVDGSAVVRGRYPALALDARAALVNGVAGRLPIERFSLRASASNGRGRLTDLTLVAPGLNAVAGGTFGIRPNDAFDFRAHVTSGDLKTLLAAASGKNPGVTGGLDLNARVAGTLARPSLASSFDLNDLTYNAITVPRVHAEIAATRQAVDVRNGAIALPRGGSVAFAGHAPLSAGPRTPIALNFAPHNVDVSAYSKLLPDGSVVAGVFDGDVRVGGTLGAPQLGGNLALRAGSYRSNTLNSPLTAIALQLNFAGTTVRIDKLHAHAAPGNFDGGGTIVLGDLRDPLPGLRAKVNLTASNARISAPKLYVGYIDGGLTATKSVRAPLLLAGNFAFSSARIPYTALLPSGGGTTGTGPKLPDVALDIGVKLGRDVRVQSGPVDIGTTGGAQLAGTLAKPTLDGQFNATDGTVAVYRTFTVQNGSSVSFAPADGITPSVDATAVTHVSDPATDILLRITGLSTKLNLAFSSQPAYSKEQILGLLVNAQALGAVSGVAQTGGTAGASGPSIAGIGEGVLNDQFTQKFLQPFSSKVGGALGLSDLNLNYNTNGAVSAVARRAIGKNISFTYGEQIGGPTPRTSVGINIGTAISGAQLTFYQASGSSQAFGGQALTPYLQSGFLATSPPNYTLQAIEPPSGSGFVFSYQRHFW